MCSQSLLPCIFGSKHVLKTFLILSLIWITIVLNVHYRLTKNISYVRTVSQISRREEIIQKSFRIKSTQLNVRIPSVKVDTANCKAIINNNTLEIKQALRVFNATRRQVFSREYYMNAAKNCPDLLRKRMYINEPLSREEADFKIAYSIMIYKDIEQFERLLRAIYRPQNYYCIHVDAKAPSMFMKVVKKILSCFPNVFLASKLVKVQWGRFSALEPDIICMKDLWRRFKDWKYFINLTGQEFPLRTNNELVAILKTFKGTADVQFWDYFKNLPEKEQKRVQYKYKGKQRYSKATMPPLTYELAMTKGACHVALPRSFATYILKSWVAKDFLEWLRVSRVPDETYIPTLNYSPDLNIPGVYRGSRPSYSRFKNWQNIPEHLPCHGKIVRDICITGVGDLALVTRHPAFFLNKFHLSFQGGLPLDCTEEWFYNRTREYYKGERIFDVKSYYVRV